MGDESPPRKGASTEGRAESGDHYEVGYKRPPKHSQFKPGQSGNRKGRSKGSVNFKTDLLETLNMLTAITQDGVSRKISTQRAVLMRLRDGALRGKVRELVQLIELARTYNDDTMVREEAVRAIEDQAILDAFLARGEDLPSEPASNGMPGAQIDDNA